MIGKLKGMIDVSHDDHVIIEVSGVGYKVFCPAKTLANLQPGAAAELYIETHVREDHIHLYGFYSSSEQATFNTLQTVKGVGTRMALAILSELSPEQIQLALAAQDTSAFNIVSGVGKKLAERMITELKDKFISAGAVPSSNTQTTGAAISAPAGNAINNDINDAVAALVSLGINRSDAYSRVSNIMSKTPDLDINNVIRLALQNQTQ